MGRPELADDERFATHGARGANMDELDGIVGAWTATLPCDEVLAVLDEHGVPAGRIFTAPDMLADPQYLAREMVQRVTSAQGWEVPMTGVVPRFSATPGAIRHAGPDARRAHRRGPGRAARVRRSDELDELHAAGVVAGAAVVTAVHLRDVTLRDGLQDEQRRRHRRQGGRLRGARAAPACATSS